MIGRIVVDLAVRSVSACHFKLVPIIKNIYLQLIWLCLFFLIQYHSMLKDASGPSSKYCDCQKNAVSSNHPM